MGWTEHFAPQPETERYLNLIADKYDLRRDIQFRARVKAARWDEQGRRWTVELRGRQHLFGAVPDHRDRRPVGADHAKLPGMVDFRASPSIPECGPRSRSTSPASAWPSSAPVPRRADHQEVAKTAAKLVVFQRTPNWCAPLHNAKIPPQEMDEIRARYDEIFKRCEDLLLLPAHARSRNTFDVSAEERKAFLEKLYGERGFGIWVGNFGTC